jgi:hypothetical protein
MDYRCILLVFLVIDDSGILKENEVKITATQYNIKMLKALLKPRVKHWNKLKGNGSIKRGKL